MAMTLVKNKKGKVKISHLLLAPMICFYWFILNIIVLIADMDRIENLIPKSGYGRIVFDFKARAFIRDTKAYILLIIILIIFLLISIHKRKSRTRLMFILFFIFSSLFIVRLLNEFPKDALMGSKYFMMVIYVLLSCVWVFYFIFSQRVKYTFNQTKQETTFEYTEPYKEQESFTNSQIYNNNVYLDHSEQKQFSQNKISDWNNQRILDKENTIEKKYTDTYPITLNHDFESQISSSSFYVKKKQSKISLLIIVLAALIFIFTLYFLFFHNSDSKSSFGDSNNILTSTLKFNDFEVESVRKKTKRIRFEIFMEHKFNSNSESEFTKEALGICHCNNKEEFLRLLETDEVESVKNIAPCIPLYFKPTNITPVLKWFSDSSIKNNSYISSLLQTQLVYYGDKAIDEIMLSLKLYDNDRIKRLLIESLSLMETEKSISYLVDILNGEKNRNFYYAAQNIKIIATNEIFSPKEAFDLVKKIYTHHDLLIKENAIKAMILFKGKMPYDFLFNAKQNSNSGIRITALKVLKKFLKENPKLINKHYKSLGKSFIVSYKKIKIDTRLIGIWEMIHPENVGYPYYFIAFSPNGTWTRMTEYVNKSWNEGSRRMCTTKSLNGSGKWEFVGPPIESITEIRTNGRFTVEGFVNVHKISIIDNNTIGIKIIDREVGAQIDSFLFSRMELDETKFRKVTKDYVKKKIDRFHYKLGIQIIRPINKKR